MKKLIYVLLFLPFFLEGQVYSVPPVITTHFSTTSNLGSSASYTSSIIDLTTEVNILTEIHSDQDGTYEGYWYSDLAGTNLVRQFTRPYLASEDHIMISTPVLAPYFRLVFVNGSTATTDIWINFKSSKTAITSQILGLDDFVPDNMTSLLTRSIIMGVDEDGLYDNAKVNKANALVTGDFELEVGFGDALGYKKIGKFGRLNEIGTASGNVDIWSNGGEYTGQPVSGAETLEIFSSDVDDTSVGTGARTIALSGLDASWNEQIDTITLNGTTPVVTTTTWRRMNRAYVVTAGTSGVSEGDITIRHSTTTANVFAVMPAFNSQTNIAAYTIPAGKTGILSSVYVSMSRDNGGAGSADVLIRIREEGGAWRSAGGDYTATNAFPVSPPSKEFDLVLPEKTDIKITNTDVSANSTAITAKLVIILKDN